MDLLETAWRVAAVACGSLLIFYVLFFYPEEEKALTTWFEKALAHLRSKEAPWSARITAFLRTLLAAVDSLCNRIYGSKILSLRSIAASVCLAAAGYLLATSLALILLTGELTPLVIFPLVPVLTAVVGVATGIKEVVYTSAAVVLVVLYALNPSFQLSGVGSPIYWMAVFSIVVAEAALIAVSRWAFRTARDVKSLRALLALSALGTLVAPVYSFLFALVLLGYAGDGGGWLFGHVLLQSYSLIGNLVPTLTGALLLLSVACAVALRLLYALLPRVVGVPLRLKLLENRKTVFVAGTVLIAAQFPEAAAGILNWGKKFLLD